MIQVSTSFNLYGMLSLLMFLWGIYAVFFGKVQSSLKSVIAIIGIFITSGLFAVASVWLQRIGA